MMLRARERSAEADVDTVAEAEIVVRAAGDVDGVQSAGLYHRDDRSCGDSAVADETS